MFSDKIDVPLYNGIFSFFGKFCGTVEGVNIAIQQKNAPKVCFHIIDHLISGFSPIP